MKLGCGCGKVNDIHTYSDFDFDDTTVLHSCDDDFNSLYVLYGNDVMKLAVSIKCPHIFFLFLSFSSFSIHDNLSRKTHRVSNLFGHNL